MFDIGFWELVVVATVALLVVGPERLPELARDAGKWTGKVRRFVHHARREIEKELRLAETKTLASKLTDLDDLMRNAPDQNQDYSASISSSTNTASPPRNE